jgi:hypothetical protein
MAAMAQQLGLSRSTLFSLITIAGTMVVFASGATFALLSDTGSISGNLSTGDVEIVLTDNATAALVFDSSAICADPIVPGDTCTAAGVQVRNAGNLDVTIAAPTPSISLTAGGSCDTTIGPSNTDWSVSVTPYLYEDGTDLILQPTSVSSSDDNAFFDVTVELLPTAQAGCEGRVATITVTILATQVP